MINFWMYKCIYFLMLFDLFRGQLYELLDDRNEAAKQVCIQIGIRKPLEEWRSATLDTKKKRGDSEANVKV